MRNLITTTILISTFAMLGLSEAYAQNWEEMEPIPTPRALSTTSVLDGKIYVIGGTTTPFGLATKLVEVYDPTTDTWNTNVPDLPVPLLRASSGVIDGKIYVTGGHHENVPGGALNTVYEFDPANGGSWTTKANMIKPRFYHETEVIDNKMYVMAGRSEDAPAPIDNSVEMYDPLTNTWIFKSSMNKVRGGFTSEVINEKIYVMGGADFNTLFSEVEVYDPQTDIWTELEDMPKVRCWHGSGMVGDYVYIFGGATSVNLVGQPIYETWKYDPMVDWTNIQIDIPEVTSALAYASAMDENGNQCLYAISGATVEFWFPAGGPYVTGKNFKLCPEVTSIMDVIVQLEESIASGHIQGFCANGNENLCDIRLEAFRNLLWKAYDFSESGDIAKACKQLSKAAERSDGENHPKKDYIIGSDAALINSLILRAMSDLGCSSATLNRTSNLPTNDVLKVNMEELIRMYPNPSKDRITIPYTVSKDSDVSISLFNSTGNELVTLVNAHLAAGFYTLNYDVSEFPNGMYTLTYRSGLETKSIRFSKIE